MTLDVLASFSLCAAQGVDLWQLVEVLSNVSVQTMRWLDAVQLP